MSTCAYVMCICNISNAFLDLMGFIVRHSLIGHKHAVSVKASQMVIESKVKWLIFQLFIEIWVRWFMDNLTRFMYVIVICRIFFSLGKSDIWIHLMDSSEGSDSSSSRRKARRANKNRSNSNNAKTFCGKYNQIN